MTRVHDRFTLVPAAYVFLLREAPEGTEALLQLRGETGYMEHHWAAAAAGHVERGETAQEAARREAAEEIGVGDLDLSFCTSMQRTGDGASIDERIDFFFTARGWSGTPRIVEPRKCRELRWCRLTDLPEPVVPHERAVLEGLAAGLAGAAGLPPYTTHGFRTTDPLAAPIPGGTR